MATVWSKTDEVQGAHRCEGVSGVVGTDSPEDG